MGGSSFFHHRSLIQKLCGDTAQLKCFSQPSRQLPCRQAIARHQRFCAAPIFGTCLARIGERQLLAFTLLGKSSEDAAVQLTIFLDIEEANRFCQVVPATSPASEAIGRAIRMREYWGSVGRDLVVECDDSEARDLLGCAESYCPSAVDKIRRAFRLAHLRIEDGHHDLLTAFSRASGNSRDKA
jgi:hypothetical protein